MGRRDDDAPAATTTAGQQTKNGVPTIAEHELFFSYSHRDIEFALRLRDALGERGKRAWVDESGIRPSERWKDAITQAIEQAAAFVFIISPDSLASPECAKELTVAGERGKRIISVLHRPVDMHAVPTVAADFQFIPPRGCFDDDFARNVDTLVEAIDTDLDWLRQTTHWEQKALEWDRAGRNDSFLLSGQELELAETYLAGQAGRRPEPTGLQNEFVLLSRRHQVAGLRRTRAWTTGALVIVSALAVLAFVLRGEAISNAHVATSRQYAAQGVAALGADPALSVLLSVRALGVDDTSQAESALRRATPAIPLLQTFVAGDPLNTAAYSPDGRRIITASRTGVATIFDVAGGRRVATLTEPPPGGLGTQNFSLAGSGLTAASFSRDGHLALTASLDTTARVWDVATGHQLAVFPAYATLQDAQFSPDAGEVLTADSNGRAAIWQAGSTRPVEALHEPGGATLNAAVFSPDGRRVLTASTDGTARVWDLATRAQLLVLHEPGGQALNDAAFSADGRRIVTASTDGTARIWDASTGTELVTLGAVSGSNLQTARFSPDGHEVVTGGSGPTATVWDAATGEQLTQLPEPQGPRITGAVFSPDGARVLTASVDGTARIWTTFPRQLLASQRSPDGSAINDVAFGPGGEFAYADAGGTAQVLTPAHPPVTIHEGTDGANYAHAGNGLNAISFSSDGRELLTASDDGTARLWSATTGAQVQTFSPTFPVVGARLVAGGSQVVTIDRSGFVDLYSVATGRQLAQCADTSRLLTPYALALSPSGTELAVAGVDGTARILALPTPDCGTHSTTLRALGKPITEPAGSLIGNVQFSADGRRLLTASNDGSTRIWNLRSGRQELVVHDPSGTRLYSARFSPDGSEIVTADGAGIAAIVNARTGKQLTTVGYALGGRFTGVAYSPDGSEIATAGFDGRASIWSAALAAPLPSVKRIALARVHRALPRAELAAYERQIH